MLIFKLQIVHTDQIAVPNAHGIQTIEQAALAQHTVEPHTAFVVAEVGVGDKPKGWDLADYVLGHFKGEEEETVRESLKNASNACKMIVLDGMEAAMNQYNKKVKE